MGSVAFVHKDAISERGGKIQAALIWGKGGKGNCTRELSFIKEANQLLVWELHANNSIWDVIMSRTEQLNAESPEVDQCKTDPNSQMHGNKQLRNF